MKFGYSAFYKTNLVDILRAENRDAIVVAGTVTQICVEDTVRGAFHEQVKTVVSKNEDSSFDQALHQASLRNRAMKYARVEAMDEYLPELLGRD